MGRLRVSISALMALIALIAVVLASLHEANEYWADAMFTLALGLFGVALLGAIFDCGDRRTTWAGFFVFGAGYLGLCYVPGFDTHVMPRLLTTKLVDDCYEGMLHVPTANGEKVWVILFSNQIQHEVVEGRVFRFESPDDITFDVMTAQTTSTYKAMQLRALSLEAFRQLAHAGLSLSLACVGAVIARGFAARRKQAGVHQ